MTCRPASGRTGCDTTASGGNAKLLRDGINDTFNVAGNASFSELLNSYASAFETPVNYDPDAAIDTTGTILAFVPDEMLGQFRSGAEAVLGAGSCHVLSIRQTGGTRLG